MIWIIETEAEVSWAKTETSDMWLDGMFGAKPEAVEMMLTCSLVLLQWTQFCLTKIPL